MQALPSVDATVWSVENTSMWRNGFVKRDLRVGFVVKFKRDQALPRIAPLVTRHLKVTSLLLNEAHPSLRSWETRTPHRLNQPEEASALWKHLHSAVPRLQAHRSFFQQPALNELQDGGGGEWTGGGGGTWSLCANKDAVPLMEVPPLFLTKPYLQTGVNYFSLFRALLAPRANFVSSFRFK